MTEEQIKSLKVGDKITVVFVVKEANDAYASLLFEGGGYYGGAGKKEWGLLKHATLVTPPPALVEVGDTVRIVPDPLSGRIHGAHYSQGLSGVTGKVAHVHKAGAKDDDGEVDDECTVWIRCEGHDFNWGVSPHCVVLVKKAVKDKYAVRCCYVGGGLTRCKVVTLGHEITVAEFVCSIHPNAKAAAEAECARLNSEWRKRQEGGAE